MKLFKCWILAMLLLFNTIFLTGCWNYREVDEMALVAGVAIDQGSAGKYRITVELMHIEGGKDSKTTSRILTMEGDSMFDAVRNIISESGDRLYWSHSKAVIISQALAKKGVVKILDWYSRDSETREDVNIIISAEPTAGEILTAEGVTETLKSIDIEKTIENQKSISKAPSVQIWEFINKLLGEGVEPIAPLICLVKFNGKEITRIGGTAVFHEDKLVGMLSEEESKDLLFIQNKIKSGILTEILPGKEGDCPISMEIFNNTSEIKPVINNGEITINIKTETEVAIDEIEGGENVIDDGGRKQLEDATGEHLKTSLEALIHKVQTEYGEDIFGFGARLYQSNPSVWDVVGKDWSKIFKTVKVNVQTKIHIKNSATISKVIQVGE